MIPRTNKALRPGDHLRVWRGLYAHHGIYIGGGTVMEHAKPCEGGHIRRVLIDEFARGARIQALNPQNSLAPHVVVRRALSAEGMPGYNALSRNCEHFAKWCKTGIASSRQVQGAAIAAVLAILIGGHIARRGLKVR